MKLEQLRLQQYRSYEECTVAWHPRLNIITGQNAFGKTNLLEAIAYLSLGNSFRGGRDYELIQWEQPFFYLEAKVSTPFGLRKLSCGCDREKKKIWQLDGVAKKTFSPVAGVLKTVFFTPDDLWLVKSAPSYRRDFLNQQMIQLYPEYYLTWNRYQKALRQRNEMLKQCRGRLPEPELIAAWDESLAASGAFIIKKREEMVRQLTPLANQLQQAISGGKETISLEYQTILPAQEVEDLSKEGIQDELLAQLAAHLRDDLLRGVTTVGPQRDDLLISINGQTAKEYGSQGQQRTAALALKLSQVELVWQQTGEYPLLLLDDVLSELDFVRRQALYSLMEGKAQTFITTTDTSVAPLAAKGARFLVTLGQVIDEGRDHDVYD